MDPSDTTIAIVTALEEEYAACRGVLDPDGHGPDITLRGNSGTLIAHLCDVQSVTGGRHVVALTQLPDAGNNAAAMVATLLLNHLPNVCRLVMCGIAGAVPNPDRPEEHVRLGDIVVVNKVGVVQYDRGKQSVSASNAAGVASDPLDGFELRSSPRPPCAELQQVVARLLAEEKNGSRPWEGMIKQFLRQLPRKNKSWRRPSPDRDVLDDSSDGTARVNHPTLEGRRPRHPYVFRGPIGAANVVLRDPARRNALRDRHGIKAVEMEGSGIADASWFAEKGYLIIRGTCDYCNLMKNDEWHHYAALIAAAFTRAVIASLAPYTPTDRRLAGPERLDDSAIHVASSIRDGISETRAINPLSKEAKRPSRPNDASTELESDPNTYAPGETISAPALATSAAELVDRRDLTTLRSAALERGVRIRELTSALESMLREFRTQGITPIAAELESLLSDVPRTGASVREAFIALARAEERRLREAHLKGIRVDVRKLRALRTEAENVVL
jgi:nucleoside phosphorylase